MANLVSSPFNRALAAAVRANVPVVIVGEPGQAKTAKITGMAEGWGYHPEVIIGSTREATDFLGVMIENDGVVSYSSFNWVENLNNAEKGLAVFDEFNTAGPSTMKGMLRVFQERFVGDTRLGGHVGLVAIMNPTETAVDAYDLPAAMANRMLHIDWAFDSAEWLDGVGTGFAHTVYPSMRALLAEDPTARKAAVAGAVTTFLRHRPELLTPPVPTDPAQAGGAWPSPRSWTNAINVLSQLEADDDEAALYVLKGLVGDGAATQLLVWMEANDLYNPAKVLQDPSIVDWSDTRADRLFSLVNSVTTMGLSRPEDWKKAAMVLTACASNGKPDVAMPGAQKLVNNVPADTRIPAVFKNAFMELFSHTRYGVTAAAA
ncbi:ATP-binding protein [Arthrobacter sp. zg-Y1110]|uniref:ATP-binding protein n=1 Tax=Arthrobacter sp. zg-Y1110 TaxID=2886932 RepID=UPI001D13AC60|nr:ATP-binding protein [Arthrobacter sp. zg-Y1110]MCC3292545.1 ATP-binding protein [Arthrobacter sp. zg-Y1110]UWX87023.1 ATP-binding protein [Arthrobacter sp. zg-Y1110]